MPESKKPWIINIVTAAESRYARLARGLFNSVYNALIPRVERNSFVGFPALVTIPYLEKEFLSPLEINFCIMDCGLDPHEVRFFKHYGAKIFKVEKITLPTKVSQPLVKAAYLERPNINVMFPGSDITMWIDADAWVQNWEMGLLPYILHALRGQFAIVPEVDRNIAFNEHHINITGGWSKANYAKFYNEDVAERFCKFPMFNNGVFAFKTDSDLWINWLSAMQIALLNNKGNSDFGVDQISLNYVLYVMNGSYNTAPLPFLCNWMVTHATPHMDVALRKFIAPMWPHEEIGIIHMLDYTKWQRVGVQRFDVLSGKTMGGDAIYMDYFDNNPVVFNNENF